MIEHKKYLNFSDVLIKPKKTTFESRKEANVIRNYTFKHSKVSIETSPIMISNMAVCGTFDVAKEASKHKIITCLHKFYSVDDYKNNLNLDNFNFVTVGKDSINYLKELNDIGVFSNNKFGIAIDYANGYMESMLKNIENIRKEFPNVVIMAGNIATPDIIRDYDMAGVDIIKCGIGSGASCLTRKHTAIGIPQLTAIMDCQEEADRYGLMVCSDGGITEIGDFSKALAVADFAMAGSMFGAHDESDGYLYTQDDKRYYTIYGMASFTALEKLYGSEKLKESHRTSEGRTSVIEGRGPINNTFNKIFGGIRSTMSYTNSHNIIDLQKNVTFIEVRETLNRIYERYTVGE